MKKILNALLVSLYVLMFVSFIAFYIMFVIGFYKDRKYYDTWQIMYMIITSGACWTFMLSICGSLICNQLKKIKENKNGIK